MENADDNEWTEFLNLKGLNIILEELESEQLLS